MVTAASTQTLCCRLEGWSRNRQGLAAGWNVREITYADALDLQNSCLFCIGDLKAIKALELKRRVKQGDSTEVLDDVDTAWKCPF